MEKLIYVVRASDVAPDAFREGVGSRLVPALVGIGAAGLALHVATPGGGEGAPLAQVSFWMECHDRRGPAEEVLRALAGGGASVDGYLVTESVRGRAGLAPSPLAEGAGEAGVSEPASLALCADLDVAGAAAGVGDAVGPSVRNRVARALTAGAPPLAATVTRAGPPTSGAIAVVAVGYGEAPA